MLQQTQAARVVERFPRFMARFPSPRELAEAPPAAVLAEWSGLGYNRRAIALQAAAAVVERDGWPANVPALERLPGIGPYTARAIASLAFTRPVGVVDTNVRRWLIRRLGVQDRPTALQEVADALATAASDTRADDWTHATMEFGARICRARAPRCDVCPIARACPSRGRAARVEVARQSALLGSERAYRGAVVRDLTSTPGNRLPVETARVGLEHDAKRIGPALDDRGWSGSSQGSNAMDWSIAPTASCRLGAATIGP